MAALKNAKSSSGPFANQTEIVRVVYDHAVDGTAADALDVLTADGDIAIVNFYAKVITACTSGGSAVLNVGISGGDDDALMDAVAVAGLTTGSLHKAPIVLSEGTPNTGFGPLPLKLASGGKIIMDTATDSFLTGKIEFVFEIAKF